MDQTNPITADQEEAEQTESQTEQNTDTKSAASGPQPNSLGCLTPVKYCPNKQSNY